MKVKFYFKHIPDSVFPESINYNSNIGFCQTMYWVDTLAKVEPSIPLYWEIYNEISNKKIISLLAFHKFPFDRNKQKNNRSLKNFLYGKNKGWIEWNDGPVVYSVQKTEIKKALDILLDELNKYVKHTHLTHITGTGFSPTSLWVNDDDFISIFAKYGYKKKAWGTFLISLLDDESDLFNKLKRSVRKSIRKCKKLGVSVKQIKSIKEFKELYYDTYSNIKENVEGFHVWQAMWEGNKYGYYKFFVALSSDEEVLATLGMCVTNKIVTEIASATSQRSYQEGIPAQDILHWEMLIYAKKQGYVFFNLAGVNPNPTIQKEIGIKRFKEKWGGRFVEYNTYEMEMYQTLYQQIIKKANRLIHPLN